MLCDIVHRCNVALGFQDPEEGLQGDAQPLHAGQPGHHEGKEHPDYGIPKGVENNLLNMDATRVRNILIMDTKRGREQSVQPGHHEGKEHPYYGYQKG
jgi:hypothetical protein